MKAQDLLRCYVTRGVDVAVFECKTYFLYIFLQDQRIIVSKFYLICHIRLWKSHYIYLPNPPLEEYIFFQNLKKIPLCLSLSCFYSCWHIQGFFGIFAILVILSRTISLSYYFIIFSVAIPFNVLNDFYIRLRLLK